MKNLVDTNYKELKDIIFYYKFLDNQEMTEHILIAK